MKKIAILLLFCMVFFSCSEITYEPGVYEGSIGGRWKTMFSARAGSQTINTQDCVNANTNGLYWTFVFNGDGNFTLLNTCNGAVLETGTYTYLNGELLLELNSTAIFLITNIREAGANRISMDYKRINNGQTEGFHLILKRA